jgi:hypothetical protein
LENEKSLKNSTDRRRRMDSMSLDASSLLKSLDQARKSLDAVRAQLVRDVDARGGNGQLTLQSIHLLARLDHLERDLHAVTETERRSSEKMIVLERLLLDNREMMANLNPRPGAIR